MIITTIEELRLVYPNHAYDTIDGMVGYIDNSEHSFLEDKLGTPLYNALQEWYDQHPTQRTSVQDYQTGYYNRLLLLCQRVVGFDALGRAAGMQAVSANNAGLNQMTADDYPSATKDNIQTYRDTCFKEAMRSLDILLATLERWTTEAAAGSVSGGTASTEASIPDASPSGDTDERNAIVTLWRQSRYYYLAAQMLLPSAVIMQQYIDFQESREKFIRMLPDQRFIQEEIIANAIGEELLDHLTEVALTKAGDAQPITTKSPIELRIVHQLRRVAVALLVERTSVLKFTKEQRQQAHDDGVRKLGDACRFIQQHQTDLLLALGATQQQLDDLAAARITTADLPDECQCLVASPLFIPPVVSATATADGRCGCSVNGDSVSVNAATVPGGSTHGSVDVYKKGDAAAWTPPLL